MYNKNSEPATLYSFVDGKGTLGFIPSITEPFCENCDRMRITPVGRLLTCLYENPGYDLNGIEYSLSLFHLHSIVVRIFVQ